MVISYIFFMDFSATRPAYVMCWKHKHFVVIWLIFIAHKCMYIRCVKYQRISICYTHTIQKICCFLSIIFFPFFLVNFYFLFCSISVLFFFSGDDVYWECKGKLNDAAFVLRITTTTTMPLRKWIAFFAIVPWFLLFHPTPKQVEYYVYFFFSRLVCFSLMPTRPDFISTRNKNVKHTLLWIYTQNRHFMYWQCHTEEYIYMAHNKRKWNLPIG